MQVVIGFEAQYNRRAIKRGAIVITRNCDMNVGLGSFESPLEILVFIAHMRTGKAQTSLRKRPALSKPLLLAYSMDEGPYENLGLTYQMRTHL